MAKLIESLQRNKKIDEVTSTKDEPPPVYLMDELADIARSSPEAATAIAEQIGKRLAAKSPVVKYKALRLVKHLCNKGCGQFQRSMQKHHQAIRDLTYFKGDPDPFKGDTPNQRVRDTAAEAVEALFASSVQAAAPPQIQGRIQGFGSSMPPTGSATYSSPPAASLGGRMTGFGSDGQEWQPNSSAASSTAPVASALSTVGSNLSSFVRNIMNKNEPQRHDANVQPTRTALNTSSSHYLGINPSTGGVPLDNYSAASQIPVYTSGGSGTGSFSSSQPVVASRVMASEEQLVSDICTPGGLRVVPDTQELQRFVEAMSNADGLRVAEVLRDKMASLSWQQRVRALCALEAVLQHGMSQACGEVAVMFQSDPTAIRNACQHPQALVRERASRVLKLLLDEDAPTEVASTAKANATQPSLQPPSMDLLGDLEAPGPAPQANTQAPTATLFGGLHVGGEFSQPLPATTGSNPGSVLAPYLQPHVLGAVDYVSAVPNHPGGIVTLPTGPALFLASEPPVYGTVGGNRQQPLDDFFSTVSLHDASLLNPTQQNKPISFGAGLYAASDGLLTGVNTFAAAPSAHSTQNSVLAAGQGAQQVLGQHDVFKTQVQAADISAPLSGLNIHAVGMGGTSAVSHQVGAASYSILGSSGASKAGTVNNKPDSFDFVKEHLRK